MMKGKCSNPDCTISETGTCLETHSDPKQCPNFSLLDNNTEVESPLEGKEDTNIPIKETFLRQFHSGNELGTLDAAEIMQKQYSHLIGIMGFYNAGKTSFLSSLYLLASDGGLQPDYLFAGSLTLQGFEERARRLRKWEQQLPEILTEHTTNTDHRTPALMHLALKHTSFLRKRYELLLTDLPGEWFTHLIDNAEVASRFFFLRRADGLILVIDGPSLTNLKTRHYEINRVQLLLQRLVFDVKVSHQTPLILFVSKCDLISMEYPEAVDTIISQAEELGFVPEIVLGVSFSSKPAEVSSGTGVIKPIKKIIEYNWPIKVISEPNASQALSRSFWRGGV